MKSISIFLLLFIFPYYLLLLFGILIFGISNNVNDLKIGIPSKTVIFLFSLGRPDIMFMAEKSYIHCDQLELMKYKEKRMNNATNNIFITKEAYSSDIKHEHVQS